MTYWKISLYAHKLVASIVLRNVYLIVWYFLLLSNDGGFSERHLAVRRPADKST